MEVEGGRDGGNERGSKSEVARSMMDCVCGEECVLAESHM